MNNIIKICTADELKKQHSIIRYFDELKDEVILFEEPAIGVRAYSSVCPHMAGEIICIEGRLKCKWHGLIFGNDGKCQNFNNKLSLKEYPVTMINGWIYISYE